MVHSDGTPTRSPKSKLLNKLELLQTTPPTGALTDIAATVIDGGLLLHSFLSVPGPIASYASLARNLLVHICSTVGREIHVLFDEYLPSSIKGSERKLTGSVATPFIITFTGPEQRPKQSGSQLKNDNFKDQLACFLLCEWTKSHYGPVFNRKILIATHGGRCFKYVWNMLDQSVIVGKPTALQGTREEADTLINLYVSKLNGNIIVRASDTDVMVILLGLENNQKQIYMDCGSGNNRWLIDINSIQTALEQTQSGLSAALPGLHAFDGCDFTSSFYSKRKLKPLDILERDDSHRFIKFFINPKSKDDTVAEEFVCRLYGFKHLNNVNEARYAKLLQMTGKINKDDPLVNTKRIDCSLLPPCSRSLCEKTKRAHYVTIMWGNADTINSTNSLDPVFYGWKNENGVLIPKWYDGPQMPLRIFHESLNTAETGDNEEDFSTIDDNGESGSSCCWISDSDDDIEL